MNRALRLVGVAVAWVATAGTAAAQPSERVTPRQAWDVHASAQAAAPQPRRRPVRDAPPRVAAPEPVVRVQVSGHIGRTSFTAADSFEAVLGTSSGLVLGGGGGVLVGRRLFVDVQVSRFSAEGERVFVTDDLQRFPLGIPTTVTVVPIDVSAGWRFAPARPRPGQPAAPRRGLRLVPYVGGGIGVLRYRETAEFAEPGDDVSESHGSYHVLGGLEVPVTRRLSGAVDGLYRWVPDALGEGGVSEVYGDTDLGGFTFRVRATFTF